MTPDCFVRELASVEDRHPKRSLCVSSKAGNQSFDRSNVWRSMLRIENQRGMSKLRLHAARLRTSLSTAPATTPVNRNAVLIPLVTGDFHLGSKVDIDGDPSHGPSVIRDVS